MQCLTPKYRLNWLAFTSINNRICAQLFKFIIAIGYLLCRILLSVYFVCVRVLCELKLIKWLPPSWITNNVNAFILINYHYISFQHLIVDSHKFHTIFDELVDQQAENSLLLKQKKNYFGIDLVASVSVVDMSVFTPKNFNNWRSTDWN